MTLKTWLVALLSIFAAFAIVSLTGCGNFGLCQNACPEGEVHDSFCGCTKPWGKVTPPTPSTPKGRVVESQCICALPESKYEAWFAGSMTPPVGSTFRVHAKTCDALVRCPRLRNDPDALPDLLENYTLAMVVEGTQTVTNLQTGNRTYGVYGHAGEAASRTVKVPENAILVRDIAPQKETSPNVLRFVTFQPSTAKEITSCAAECSDNEIGPKCLSTAIPQSAQGPLGALVLKAADPAGATISTAQLHKLFGLKDSDDPCMRGPSIVSSRGVYNLGGACNIDSDAPDIDLKLRLKIPNLIDGAWTDRSAKHMQLSFPSTDHAPSILFLRKSDQTKTSYLDKRFGGAIDFAEFTGDRFFVHTSGGCTGVQVTK